MRTYAVFSAVFGLVSAVPGVILASYLEQPPGPVVVVCGIVLFAVTVVINWRKKTSL